MNFGIKLNGDFLDLYPDTVVSLQDRNMIFSGTSSDILPGSLQIPVSVPLTSQNKRLLNYPHLVANASSLLTDAAAQIALGGKVLPTLLSVTGANEHSSKVQSIINPLTKLKKVKLRALDLGGVRSIGADSAAARAHAKDTTLNPLNYDYIFFPVQNPDFLSEIPDTGGNERFWQNYYDPALSGGQFVESVDAAGAMPYVRVDYLLERIFADTGFAFINRWQINNELKKLVLYNNYSIYTEAGTWGTDINLINHVPNITATEFIKVIMSNFALGLFVDFENHKIELIPIRDLLSKPAVHDWSGKVLRTWSGSRNKFNAPDAYRYEVPDDDAFFNNIPDVIRPTDYTVVDTYNDMASLVTDGTYFVKSLNAFVEWTTGQGGGVVYMDSGAGLEYDTDTEFIVKTHPLMQINLGANPQNIFYPGVAGLNFDGNRYFPFISQPGIIPSSDNKSTGDIPLRFTIFRGYNLNYPTASAAPYYPGFKIGDYSLFWNGEEGIYHTWYRQWHQMLRYAKPLKAEINLSLSEYLLFSKKDKIRIDGMEYFVKSMKVSFNRRGLLPVQCDLISVI